MGDIEDKALPEVKVDEFSFSEEILKRELVGPLVAKIDEAIKADNHVLRDVNLYRLVHVFREAVTGVPKERDRILKAIFDSFRELSGENEDTAINVTSKTQDLYAQFAYTNGIIPHHEAVSFEALLKKEDAKVEALEEAPTIVESTKREIATVALSERFMPLETASENKAQERERHQIEKVLKGAILFSSKIPSERKKGFRDLAITLAKIVEERGISKNRLNSILFRLVGRKFNEKEEDALKSESKTRTFLAQIPEYPLKPEPVPEPPKAPTIPETPKIPDQDVFEVMLDSRVEQLVKALHTDGAEDDIRSYKSICKLLLDFIKKDPAKIQEIYSLLFKSIQTHIGENDEEAAAKNSRTGSIFFYILDIYERAIDEEQHGQIKEPEKKPEIDSGLFIVAPVYTQSKALKARSSVREKLKVFFHRESPEVKKIKKIFSKSKIIEFARGLRDGSLFEGIGANLIWVEEIQKNVSRSFIIECIGREKYEELLLICLRYDMGFKDKVKTSVLLSGNRPYEPKSYTFACTTEEFFTRIMAMDLALSDKTVFEIISLFLYLNFSPETFLDNSEKFKHLPDFKKLETRAMELLNKNLLKLAAAHGFKGPEAEEAAKLIALGVDSRELKNALGLMKSKGMTPEEAARYIKKKGPPGAAR